MSDPTFFSEQPDDNAADRKKDHIELALKSKVDAALIDSRFYYEPLLCSHPVDFSSLSQSFLDKEFRAPLWVSSMTGGTALAGIINKNLALACAEFGMGMGLGSCRQLLYDDTYLADFQIRKWIGNQALYANLGIAQLETLVEKNQLQLVTTLLDKIDADGLIIHVNPMQEWLQPEGDRFLHSPLDTIKRVLETLNCPLIVKEVGQGMGPQSLKALMELPLAAIDFAASGGTNFALLEILRSSADKEVYQPLSKTGHSALEMVLMYNQLLDELGNNALCKQVIISGGIQDFLDGYYLMGKLQVPSIYGQASALLQHARASYAELQAFITAQLEGLAVAKAYLQIR